MADAESGRFSIIVVHKMDRFARKLRVALECLEQLGRAHVGVVSVSEPDLDYSTPQGFLFLSMLGALAEWYSRNLSTETRKGWAERKRRGLYAGRLPFGTDARARMASRVPDTRPLELDGRTTSNHEGLLLAFERAAEGATDAEVAEALNAAGYRPSAHARRARFTRDAARTMLANRFYVGELPLGKRGAGGWLEGRARADRPVDLFEAVQRQRARRVSQREPVEGQPRTRAVHALSGMVAVRRAVASRCTSKASSDCTAGAAAEPGLSRADRRSERNRGRGGGLPARPALPDGHQGPHPRRRTTSPARGRRAGPAAPGDRGAAPAAG